MWIEPKFYLEVIRTRKAFDAGLLTTLRAELTTLTTLTTALTAQLAKQVKTLDDAINDVAEETTEGWQQHQNRLDHLDSDLHCDLQGLSQRISRLEHKLRNRNTDEVVRKLQVDVQKIKRQLKEKTA